MFFQGGWYLWSHVYSMGYVQGWACPGSGYVQGAGYVRGLGMSRGEWVCSWWWLVCSGGWICPWSGFLPPVLMTPTTTCTAWQVSSTLSTGKHSCFLLCHSRLPVLVPVSFCPVQCDYWIWLDWLWILIILAYVYTLCSLMLNYKLYIYVWWSRFNWPVLKEAQLIKYTKFLVVSPYLVLFNYISIH